MIKMIKMFIYLKDGRIFEDEFCSYENAVTTLLNHYIFDCNREKDIKKVIIK